MKKAILYSILIVSILFNIFMLVINRRLEGVVDNCLQLQEGTENTISVVDTIYGRKYVIDVDTVTGDAKVIGLRHSMVVIEDSIPE